MCAMKDFFSDLYSTDGIKFIATVNGRGFAHYPCRTIDEMVEKAREIDSQGRDAYHACASYEQESYTDSGGKRRQRTAENAQGAKAYWLDIDCGPDKAEAGKGYATINDALPALQKFIGAVRLPKPSIIFSGGGLHVYFLLTETISKEQWKPVANQLKALTQCPSIRLIADDSRTSDIASILRPIGTHNYKRERNGAVVTQKIAGVVTDFDQFSLIISKAHETHCNCTTQPSRGIQLGTLQSAPDPETPENIARVKSALASINPDCDRNLWRDICFSIHALGWSCSEELARNWSKGEFI
jgi:hypothetical protein